jgi:antirestriction protein ArdC
VRPISRFAIDHRNRPPERCADPSWAPHPHLREVPQRPQFPRNPDRGLEQVARNERCFAQVLQWQRRDGRESEFGRVFRDGLRSRERLAAPVAEIRDVQSNRSCPLQSVPDEPLCRNYRQDHRRAGGWPCALGPAVGKAGRKGFARHAAKHYHEAPLFGDQCTDPMGRSHRTRLLQPSWLNFRQALGLGGNVRRGECGTTVVYADRFTPEDERRRAKETVEEPGAIAFLKRFTVFSTDQCEALPEEIVKAAPPPPASLIEAQAEALIAATGADFRIGGTRAFYNPVHNFVQAPPPQAYFEAINWHRTAFHELSHWSGAASRLGRDLSGSFGSKSYAREELVAEMAGAFVCASLGITPTVRHADYIGSWLDVLRENDRAIIRAAGAASKAADYLLGFQPDRIEPVEATTGEPVTVW